MRTPGSDRVIKRLSGKNPARSSCLSAAEVATIGKVQSGQLRGNEALPDKVRLPILKPADLSAQLAAVRALAEHVEEIAKHVGEPQKSTTQEITATAQSLRTLGGGLASLRSALKGGDATTGAFGDGGPVSKFSDNLVGLVGEIETIVWQGDDVRAIRRAVHGDVGRAINSRLDLLARDSAAWACADAQARRDAARNRADQIEPRLAAMTFDKRLLITREWIAAGGVQSPVECSSGSGAASPIGQMLEGLKTAHAELVDAADEQYTAAQRREIARATLASVGGVFSAAAKLASSAAVFL
jgi:hypothetical protein